jgi:hypothetical protein
MTHVTRRQWLLALVSVTMIAPTTGAVSEMSDEELRKWIDTHLPRGTLTELADAYRARHPEEHEDMIALELLADRSPGASLEAHLSMRVRRDFDDDRLENLAGWIISRTEARLITLAGITG